jgi:SAM-dependent methyltransferase
MTRGATTLYEGKDAGYYSAARLDLVKMLPTVGGLRVLEVGAGDGETLREIRRRGLATYTVAVDITAPREVPGRPPAADVFLVGDLESMDLEPAGEEFDVIIAADVLEHLMDPWRAVAKLARLLRPGGLLLSSIPNFRNHRAWRRILLAGDFRYEEAGLLDRTHLRFFCRRNIRQLFEGAGLVVDAMEENMGGYGWRNRALDWFAAGTLHEFFVFQYLTCARKPSAQS